MEKHPKLIAKKMKTGKMNAGNQCKRTVVDNSEIGESETSSKALLGRTN